MLPATINALRLSCKVPRNFVQFQTNLKCLNKILQYKISWNSVQQETCLNVQTDRHEEVNRLFFMSHVRASQVYL